MFTLEFFLLLLMGHFIGDYILQNDWQALQKKEKKLPLFVHCSIYTVTCSIILLKYLMTLDRITLILSVIVIFYHILF